VEQGEARGMFKRKKKPVQTAARKLVASTNPKSIISEQFRTIRTNINFSMPDKELQTLLFTSAVPGEGKSTTASNVAIVFAQEGKKVLLVDSDMRKPTMHYTFRTMNISGLSNLLTRKMTLQEVVKQTDIEGLNLLTCGPLPPNPAELLSSKTMESLMEEMTTQFDIIIFDAPPLLSVADAQILSNKCDGTIFVVNSGTTQKDNAVKAKEALQTSKANIIGTVLNNFVLDKDHYYYQYYATSE
jgi:capsular exopolysaccharide synthesis family protein